MSTTKLESPGVFEQTNNLPTEVPSRDFSIWRKRLFAPWFVAAVLQLPYAALYLYYLWASTHYQFYPILLVVVGYLIYTRWSDEYPVNGGNRWATFLGVAGIFLAIAATALVSAWLGYLGFVLTLAASFAHKSDRDTGRPLTYLAWPLLIVWQPPFSDLDTADTYLIQYLQQLSARMSSRLLDVIGVPHFYFGNVIEIADRSFSVEQGCSGVQSFFAIVCIAALMMVAFRRSLTHTAILMLSSVLWTILMNTLRIALIPLTSIAIGLDLSHGTPHQVIGFLAMGLATWMLLSTDQLLSILLRVPSSTPTANDESVARDVVSAKVLVGVTSKNPPTWSTVSTIVCLVLFALSIVQLIDLQKKTFRLVSGNVFLNLNADDLPNELAGWKNIDYQLESRTTDADYGERSDIWRYQAEPGVTIFSVDQTFRLWHDLTVCYRNAGWRLDKKEVIFGKDKAWQTVFATFSRRDGRYAMLAYCLFDRSGLPLEVPGYLDLWNATLKRLEKRFSFSAGELFREQTCYQVQVFLEADRSDAEKSREQVVQILEMGRERIRSIGLSRLDK